MNKKAYRVLKYEIERRGGELRNVEQGQKHEIATADFGGRLVDFGVSRGERDAHRIRYLVRNTLRRAGIQHPGQHDVGNDGGEGDAGLPAQDPQERT